MHYPFVIRKTENGGERSFDLPSCLLQERIILLDSAINSDVAMSIVAQLLYLDSKSDDPIYMYINSPGGSISDGLAIYDIMNKIKSPVVTICLGMAASMAAFILCSGSKGKRYCLPNSTVMIHQPLGGAEGQATEILIVAKRIEYLRNKMYSIMAKNTDNNYETLASACERDNYLTPEEAKDFGLIDEIIESIPKAYDNNQKGEDDE